jgi:hypothetical protein
MSRTTVRIPIASRDELEAWLYLPEEDGPHPVVVMAHGMGAIIIPERTGLAIVDLEAKRQYFIDKAKEAEDDASNAPDADTKEIRLRIPASPA